MEGITIRKISSDDGREVFNQIALIHKKVIDQGFLASFSLTALSRLYRAIAGSKLCFLFGAFQGDRVVGFICGSESTDQFYKEFFMKNSLIMLPLIINKLFSIKNIKRIFETLFYPSKEECRELPKAEILNFCVLNEMQGKGVGKRLFASLTGEFKHRNIQQIKIVTGESQESAQNFYAKHNASLVEKIEIHKGTGSLIYLYDITA